MKKIAKVILLMLTLLAGEAMAATCTSKASGNWDSSGTWNCTSGSTPAAGDTVILASPFTVSLNNNNRTVAALTINAGATLNDDNQDLTVTGNVVNNGIFGTNGGALRMTGVNATLSGSGAFNDTDVEIDASGISLPAGSSLNFTNQAQVRVGRNNTATFTINGAITGTGLASGDRILRVYQNSSVTINGSITAANAYIRVEQNASVTNNGAVSVQYLDSDGNNTTSVWTQGANSSLTVTQTPTNKWRGTLNASAAGNTVTYNSPASPLTPSASTYFNLAGTGVTCPHGFTVLGNDPCPAGSGSITSSPSNCTTAVGTGATIAWTNPSNVYTNDNVLYATAGLVNGKTTDYLNCTGFNFSGVPGGATITGITVYVDRKASRNNRIRDAFVYLIKGGAVSTVYNAATTTSYTTADVNEAHGGAGNLWGTTWTQADVTTANFGVAFASTNYSTNTTSRTVSVDHIQVKVDYMTATLHHVSINAPATAMSLSEIPVVIAPHTSAHGAITAAGTISLSTSTGTGDWTIGSGTGTLTPGAANSGLANYTLGAAESSVTLGFTSQAAGTVTLNVADSGGADMLLNTPAGEKANTINFSAASFVFTSSACTHNVAFGTVGQCAKVVWSPRTAGQSLASIYVTSVNASGTPTRLHPTQVRTRNMQFGLSCHDPVAHAGVGATFSATAVTLPLCQANGATPTSWTTGVDISFPGGSPSIGPYSFNYGDVGKVEMWMRNSAATTELGSSGAFVVRPSGFVLSAIKCTTINAANCGAGALAMPTSGDNPAANNAAGTTFIRTGHPFTATVTAVNSAAAATPNYGKETTPESVKLNPALVPGLGLTNNPAIVGAFGSFANGITTGTAFTWDEVGIITITPSVLDADYLGAGNTTGTTTGNIGRFYPHHFGVTPDASAPVENRSDICAGGVLVADGVTPCTSPAFTYMGEQMNAQFTLTAQAASGASTSNYAGNFAKLNPSTASNATPGNTLGFGAVDTAAPTYLSARLDTSLAPSGSFNVGVADIVARIGITRGVADGPYAALSIGVAPADSDGVTADATLFDLGTANVAVPDHVLLGTTEVRYGRMKIANAHGSELLPLPIAVTAQYWNDTTYVTNILDNNSTFAATDVVFDNYTKNLNATNYPNSGATVVTPASVVFDKGAASYRLAKPGAGNNGSVDMTVAVPDYLKFNWKGAGNANPTARATFGVYKGNSNFIYLRENY